jgi:hypothetical protein
MYFLFLLEEKFSHLESSENLQSNKAFLEYDINSINDQDLAFEAMQVSQIITLQCEILKDQILEGKKESPIETIDSISKRAIHIGRIMKRLRKA